MQRQWLIVIANWFFCNFVCNYFSIKMPFVDYITKANTTTITWNLTFMFGTKHNGNNLTLHKNGFRWQINPSSQSLEILHLILEENGHQYNNQIDIDGILKMRWSIFKRIDGSNRKILPKNLGIALLIFLRSYRT